MNNSNSTSEANQDRREPVLLLTELLEASRARLRLLVEMRMDRRVRARVDASDVIQEAFAEAARRFPDYEKERKMTPYVWLRFLTLQQLTIAHRQHLGVQARTALREQQLHGEGETSLESGAIAICLAGGDSTPSVKVARAEEIQHMITALDAMEPLDREVLALRHFEQLEHAEIGELLGLSAAAVSSRYRRALTKVGQAMKKTNESG